jgi:hypothetical protein
MSCIINSFDKPYYDLRLIEIKLTNQALIGWGETHNLGVKLFFFFFFFHNLGLFIYLTSLIVLLLCKAIFYTHLLH